MRALLTPSFSARRMASLRPRVQELVDGLLDEMGRQTPPADFHEAVSFPLPALVICALLGVPYVDRADFRQWSDEAADMTDAARSRVVTGNTGQIRLPPAQVYGTGSFLPVSVTIGTPRGPRW
jgi:cytochrome P450